MRNLPVSVSEQEIEEMFAIADTDRDDKISYEVNQTECPYFPLGPRQIHLWVIFGTTSQLFQIIKIKQWLRSTH